VRSETEVRQMAEKLGAINERLWRQMEAAREFDTGVQLAFNNNGGLICALEWVLGAETIKIHPNKEGAL